MILLASIISSFVKYLFHTIDHQSAVPWDNKSVYIFYLELIVGKQMGVCS